MSEFKENYREFWVYRNEEYAPTYACDFNQRGFVPSRNRESIHVIEYAALEQAEAKIKSLEAILEDRNETIMNIKAKHDKVAISSSIKIKELEAKLAIAVEALEEYKEFP